MKKFNMLDEEFTCENCGKKVNKLEYRILYDMTYYYDDDTIKIFFNIQLKEAKDIFRALAIRREMNNE